MTFLPSQRPAAAHIQADQATAGVHDSRRRLHGDVRALQADTSETPQRFGVAIQDQSEHWIHSTRGGDQRQRVELHGASQQGPQHPLQGSPAQHRLQPALLQGKPGNRVNKNGQLIHIDVRIEDQNTDKMNKMLAVVIHILFLLTLVLKCGGVEDTVNPSLLRLHHHRYPLPGWNVEGRCGVRERRV